MLFICWMNALEAKDKWASCLRWAEEDADRQVAAQKSEMQRQFSLQEKKLLAKRNELKREI